MPLSSEIALMLAGMLPGIVILVIGAVLIVRESKARRSTSRAMRIYKIGIGVIILGGFAVPAILSIAGGRITNAIIIIVGIGWIPVMWFVRAARTRPEV